MFMQSSGGLTDAALFQGKDAILSGPAGGIVGAARTAEAAGHHRIIGFDMGGTSTDVTHYAGTFERSFETIVAGVRLRAPEMDARLHAERLDANRLRRPLSLSELPDGAMAVWRKSPHLIAGGRLWPWSFDDYGAPQQFGADAFAPVITPASILAALKGGYRPRPEGTPLDLG